MVKLNKDAIGYKQFKLAIPIIIRLEGGYVNNPDDPGGETKYGICKRDNENVDIKKLTIKKASEIYYNEWFLKFEYYRFDYQRVLNKVFSTAINIGQEHCVKILQQSVNKLLYDKIGVIENAGLVVDGQCGVKTFERINCAGEMIIEIFKGLQWEYYKKLIDENEKLKVFQDGWIKRAESG